MGTYLQQYGTEDERRSRIIKRIILICIAIAIICFIAYLVLRNYPEKQKAKEFLTLVNEHKYRQAYAVWGCGTPDACPNYDFQRFMEDWGPSKDVKSPWKIASIDGCKTFVTVNVQARGSELQSLMVERGSHIMGFAPAPECQEKQWRWKQFFHRLFGGH